MPIQDDSIKLRFLYVLELEDNTFYVGQTAEDLQPRIKKHFKGKGSAWTRMNRPVEVKEIIDLGMISFNQAEEIENEYTIKYMDKYHWTRVRGGFFCNTDPDQLFKILKSHQARNTVKGIDFV